MNRVSTSGELRGARIARRALLWILILCLAGVCIRSAVASSGPEQSRKLARAVWAHHPDVLRPRIMIEVAEAARAGQPLPSSTKEHLRLLSDVAPLAAEPFAVEGALALRRGQVAKAEELFLAARARDPRNAAVRFLLANAFLQRDQVLPALNELTVLTQISPQLTPSITGVFAAYARTPGAAVKLKRAIAGNPGLENSLLAALAEDPRNAPLILALAWKTRADGDLLQWQQKLLSSLLEAGKAADAAALWQRFTGRNSRDLGDFSDSSVASPFTWKLLSSSAGVAIARARTLEVEFSGQADASLASTVLTLEPGRYEFRWNLDDVPREPIVHWVITCVAPRAPMMDASVSSSPTAAASLEVPPGCPAQRLELKGFAQTFPTEVAFSVSSLQIKRAVP